MITLFRNLLVLLSFLVIHLIGNASDIEVRSIDNKSYPKIKGKIWVRNPNATNTQLFTFKEGGEELKVTYGESSIPKSDKKGRSIILLIENHFAHFNRTQYYIKTIQNAIDNGAFTENDEIAVVTFDCNRPEYGNEPKQLLDPENLNFVKGTNALQNELNNISKKTALTQPDCSSKSQIYTSIYQTILKFSGVKTDNPKAVFVFCDDFSIVDAYKEDAIVMESYRAKIPVYGFVYYQNIQRKFGIKGICERTYGVYYLDDSKNNPVEMGDYLSTCLGTLDSRLAGVEIPFEFETKNPKGGAPHSVDVDYAGEKIQFEYSTPELTLWEWMKENIILVLALFLLVVGIIIAVILYIKKQKQKDLLKDEEIARTHNEIIKQQEESDRLKRETNQQISSLKEQERLKEQAAEDAKRKILAQKDEERLIVEMLEAGSFAKFMSANPGETGFFEINKPTITIGRNTTCNFPINHASVSREHAIIKFANGAYYLTDSGSANGTFVNGNKITEQKLKHGDHIMFGAIAVSFHQ